MPTARLAASPLPQAIVPAVAALARAAIQANYTDQDRVSQKATDRARQDAQRLVAPVTATVFAGDIVLRRGEAVTPAVTEKLRALGLQNPRLDPSMVVSVTLLVALMVGIVGVYLARYFRAVYASNKLLLLLSLLVALSVLGLRLGGMMLGARLPDAQFGYVGMLCVATAGMLIAALIHPRLALVIAALLAAQSGLILGNGLRFSLMTLLSSLVAIYAVSDIRSRGDVLRAAALLGATNALLCVVVGRIEGDAWADIGHLLPWALRRGWSPWRCSGWWRPCSSGPSASRPTSACWNCPTRTGPSCSVLPARAGDVHALGHGRQPGRGGGGGGRRGRAPVPRRRVLPRPGQDAQAALLRREPDRRRERPRAAEPVAVGPGGDGPRQGRPGDRRSRRTCRR